MFVNRKQIYKFYKFCLGSIPEKFGAVEFREGSFKGNVHVMVKGATKLHSSVVIIFFQYGFI